MPAPGLPRWFIGRHPRRTLVRALLLGGACYLFFGHVVRPVQVRGISMEPTLRDGSLHAAALLRFVRREPHRGEVVIIAMAGRRAYYVKRVLGLPGETVAFEQGRLLVDGQVRSEPYLQDAGSWDLPPTALGAGQYFVAGDNRAVPLENHLAGTVSREHVAGGLLF